MASTPSIFTPALELLPHAKTANGVLQTKPFLDICRLVLPIVDRFGAALSIVKSDIGGNIQRLETCYRSDPVAFEALYDIVRRDIENKAVRRPSSNTDGLLWLTRAMDFLTAMLRNLRTHEAWTLYQSAAAAYDETLKRYHGWIAAAAFKMALNLCPEKATFLEKLGPGDIFGDMDKFLTLFRALLQENHDFMREAGVDDIQAS